jgi:hypothetical protein
MCIAFVLYLLDKQHHGKIDDFAGFLYVLCLVAAIAQDLSLIHFLNK